MEFNYKLWAAIDIFGILINVVCIIYFWELYPQNLIHLLPIILFSLALGLCYHTYKLEKLLNKLKEVVKDV